MYVGGGGGCLFKAMSSVIEITAVSKIRCKIRENDECLSF